MVTIRARWADDTLAEYGDDLERLRREFPKVLPRIVNQAGNKAKTQVIRSLTKQTGLPRKTIVKAVQVGAAGGKRHSYEMVTRGGNIRLKYLNPKETRPGVVAKPFGKRQLFRGAFMYGGRFPNRHGGKFDGHVMRRIGYGKRSDGGVGWKLTQVRSGMFIPTEMTTGATLAAFERTAGPLLRQRVDAAIKKLLP
jgi:hypothetical protein